MYPYGDRMTRDEDHYESGEPLTIVCSRCEEEALFEESVTAEDGGAGRWCRECSQFFWSALKDGRDS